MTHNTRTRQAVKLVIARLPGLCAFGFRDAWRPDEIMLTDDTMIEQVDYCLGFIERWCVPTSIFRRSISSYGWKHIAENALGKYVRNGAFIAAAGIAGYRIERDGPDRPNAVFNMRTPSAALWAHLDKCRVAPAQED